MYSIGDLVVYGGEGVCRVEDIGLPSSSVIDRNKKYYTLSPIYRDGRIFTPVDTKVFMRPVLSKEQAEKIIDSIPEIDAMPMAERDPKQTERNYKQFISSHKCSSMIAVIKAVHQKRGDGGGPARKTSQTDERYMKMAEELLYGEFAISLDIPRSSVKTYVEDRVTKLISGKNKASAD
ncbi:MAG: CarD family transcriptional regulator [Oscillospiraceae bacterium]|jgi:CarD family transcriptional regulator